MRTHLATTARSLRYAAALTAVAALALAGCTNTPATATSPTTGAASTPGPAANTTTSPAPEVELTPNVTDANPVTVDTIVSVAAKGGTITNVEMSYADPKAGAVQVEGSLAPDGSTWTAQSLLEPGMKYSLKMVGRNADGRETTRLIECLHNAEAVQKSRRSSRR